MGYGKGLSLSGQQITPEPSGKLNPIRFGTEGGDGPIGYIDTSAVLAVIPGPQLGTAAILIGPTMAVVPGSHDYIYEQVIASLTE